MKKATTQVVMVMLDLLKRMGSNIKLMIETGKLNNFGSASCPFERGWLLHRFVMLAFLWGQVRLEMTGLFDCPVYTAVWP